MNKMVVYIKESKRFEFRGLQYNERHLAAGNGWRWDPTDRLWFTHEVENAAKLWRFGHPKLREKLRKYVDANSPEEVHFVGIF